MLAKMLRSICGNMLRNRTQENKEGKPALSGHGRAVIVLLLFAFYVLLLSSVFASLPNGGQNDARHLERSKIKARLFCFRWILASLFLGGSTDKMTDIVVLF